MPQASRRHHAFEMLSCFVAATTLIGLLMHIGMREWLNDWPGFLAFVGLAPFSLIFFLVVRRAGTHLSRWTYACTVLNVFVITVMAILIIGGMIAGFMNINDGLNIIVTP